MAVAHGLFNPRRHFSVPSPPPRTFLRTSFEFSSGPRLMNSVFPAPPSFNCVPSDSLPDDTSRLPAYRPAHIRRFHPYARTTPSCWQRILTANDYPPEDMLPITHRSSFALSQTDDMFLNGDIEIVVEQNAVKLFIEQHWRSRKFRVVVNYFAWVRATAAKVSVQVGSARTDYRRLCMTQYGQKRPRYLPSGRKTMANSPSRPS
ncbi:hypothetical protein K488DRAFT_86759 [Vararia minispora EC-137]|uniref:Uncharacterized protein n=1 Tax=Vararia minispora EC-137 TaxID=1314806 RepID=A0ACB8QIM6_9AGAM|nr:hypothetical protein K488DRAFT_86759 [Vararia minispora EC-137]